MNKFKQLPLTVAVLGALVSTVAQAQAIPNVNLDAQVVTIDRQGAKVKTNVVTTAIKNEKTETDLRGLLKEEPAIDFGGGNGTSQFVTIRGMGQNSIDLKVDNAYTDSQFLYHQGRFMLDPAMVKIVSVQKGAGAASAGIGATNGAIVAKTVDAQDLLKGSDKNFGVKLNAGYHSNEGHSYGVAAFAKNDGFDFLLAGNRINDENYHGGKDYKNLLGNDVVTNSALDKVSGLVKVGANAGKHRFVLSNFYEQHEGVRGVREEFDFANNALTAASLTQEQQAKGWKLGEETKDRSGKTVYYILDKDGKMLPNLEGNAPVKRKMIQNQTNLEWSAQDLGPISSATANVYYRTALRKSVDDSKNGYGGNVEGSTENAINTMGANLNLDWQAGDSTILKTGLNFRHQEVDPQRRLKATDIISVRGETPAKKPLGVDINNQEKTDIGAYIEAIGEIGDVTATAGVRYDRFEFKAMDGKKVANDSLSPSLGLIWQPTDNLSFNGNLSVATRSPRMYDALTAAGHRGVVSIASNVKAERAKNAEIGFNYNNGSLLANGSYFYQRIDNALGNAAAARHGVASRVEIDNIGHMTNKGYELGLGYRVGGLTAKVAVADSKPEMHGVQLSGNPEFAIPVGRTWTGSVAYRFQNPNLEIGVRNRTVEKTDRNVLVHKADQKENRDAYSVTDVFANWKPYGNDKMNVNLAVNNVTNENYRPHSQRAAVTTLPGAGRDYRVGVNFTF